MRASATRPGERAPFDITIKRAPTSMLHPFQTPPADVARPREFPSPFRADAVHPWAEQAVRETMTALADDPVFAPARWQGPTGGKMLGVLVVADADGALSYLRAFAGTVHRAWRVDGFVPPVVSVSDFHAIWDPAGDEIAALDAEVLARDAAAECSTDADTRAELLRQRDTARDAQKRRSLTAHESINALYRFVNVRGETATLASLFDPHPPPGGAGDCAAPKLLQYAHTHQLRPVALAEFWWGGQPRAGGRHHGQYYPACRGRCGVILPFMLEGLRPESSPPVDLEVLAPELPEILHEDDALFVVHKPCGMLSVPGRGPSRRDCVERRLQVRAGLSDETWPRMVHRLDLATSGVMVVPKHKAAYVHIQRQFARREVQKRYLALVEGHLPVGRGRIELALARDLADRPRQCHDPARGKAASTRWEVLEHAGPHTRVAFYPETGRTHQLRVHAAHARGLNAPIVGDRLYGFAGPRLMLHAEQITVRHPDSDTAMTFRAPCPF